jgi:hypothetical protein
MTAGKETGAVRAPISKLVCAETIATRAALQPCTHSATVTERLPATHRHYARLTCGICGRFLRWLPKPQTIERRTLNAFKLARLAMRPDLTGWERQFIRSVSGKKHLSPKQEALLVRLYATYLEAQP